MSLNIYWTFSVRFTRTVLVGELDGERSLPMTKACVV